MATAVQTLPRRVGWRASLAGELVAACLGTFVLICFGDGVVAMPSPPRPSGRSSAG